MSVSPTNAATLICALTLAVPLTSSALPIDFTSGFYSTVAPGIDNVYTESGFTFATPSANHFDSGPNGFAGPGGRPHLIFHEGSANPVNNVITLTFAGGAFDFVSFDLVADPIHTPTFPSLQNPAMTVACSDGTTLVTPNFPALPHLVSVGCMNVTTVTFDINTTSNVPLVFLDNAVAIPVAIPEPHTAALLALGLIGLLLFAHRSPEAL